MKRAIFSLILAFLLILSILFLERIFLDYPLEIINLLYFSIVYSIPIIITFIFGYWYNAKNPDSKRIFIYAPLYSLVPAVIAAILYIYGIAIFDIGINTGEGIITFFLIFVIIYSIISFFLATIIISNSKIYKIIIASLIIIIIIITCMLSANYLIKCGLTGCTQDNLVRYAYETNDIEKCERAQSEYGGFSGSPILGLSKIISVGTRGECFLKLAELKNDPLICERAGYVDDECYMKAAQRGFQIMCDKINNQDSKSNCYYAYAFVLKNESLCEFVHPTKNQYRDKGGCIYEALH